MHLLISCLVILAADPDEPLPDAKPLQAMTVSLQPGDRFSFQRNERELCRYHFGRDLRRPFLYPLIGPSGRSLTRLGHPHDPESHSHHNSVWISHHDVNGVSFWGDRGANPPVGQIVHQRIDGDGLLDGNDVAGIVAVNHWVAGGQALLEETRRVYVFPLADQQWLLVLDLTLAAKGKPATLGKTPFGPLGVRMAKSIGVHDGGGLIRNSAGDRQEVGVFWKPAKWVDYSGPIAEKVAEGITLMDHPDNPSHPTPFHVRGDGWMGVALTQAAAREIPLDRPLHLRYGLWVHAGVPAASRIEEQYQAFVKRELPTLPIPRPGK
jgi:hypothetical protein